MWEHFDNLGPYESNLIDTANQSIEQTISTIKAVIEKNIPYSRFDAIQPSRQLISVLFQDGNKIVLEKNG